MSQNEHARKEKGLQPRQVAAIVALLTARDVPSAAEKCGVPAGTLRRWLTSDEAFKAALQEAEREAVGNVTRRLAGVAGDAITVIKSIMYDQALPASVRLRAAQTVLEQLLRLRELVDVDSRLLALEAGLQAQQRKAETVL